MKKALQSFTSRYLGPFPINPLLAFLFAFAYYFAHVNGLLSGSLGAVDLIPYLPLAFLLAVLFGSVTGAMAYLLEKIHPVQARNLGIYIFEVAVISTTLTLISRLFTFTLAYYLNLDLSEIWSISPLGLLINVPVYLVVLSLLHQSERLIRVRLIRAGSQISKLKSDRKLLIESDEEIRRQVAQYLHDRVQSDLMVAVIQLRSLNLKSTEERESEIESVFEKLERLRSVDLSRLSQILAPNFSMGGLPGSLQVLIEQYNQNFETSLIVDPDLGNIDDSAMLGIYRIVEQALLNTITHGPATNVEIVVKRVSPKIVHVRLKDDGPGSDSSHVGVGTTIIDSWVDQMDGEKEIMTAPGQGYELLVKLEVSSKSRLSRS
jgi:signal transduction histidine kinase